MKWKRINKSDRKRAKAKKWIVCHGATVLYDEYTIDAVEALTENMRHGLIGKLDDIIFHQSIIYNKPIKKKVVTLK